VSKGKQKIVKSKPERLNKKVKIAKSKLEELIKLKHLTSESYEKKKEEYSEMLKDLSEKLLNPIVTTYCEWSGSQSTFPSDLLSLIYALEQVQWALLTQIPISHDMACQIIDDLGMSVKVAITQMPKEEGDA
jgi:signal transduction histidine kinase